ncbi:Cortactin-binding protein 2 [Tetrabaena socialis]|uniref:Cortactin-binding protein 2 n=1 Tax=Tetrabaena socialis TaxID=47790 RepID=A0A2J8ADQ1_9CHLO|nr:Cortactin-binding protein 2 [Tetrabaena socialis]|eukprot:PNH10647.1 Cortactin-binding protein 2 [Tetrabaena socialis]
MATQKGTAARGSKPGKKEEELLSAIATNDEANVAALLLDDGVSPNFVVGSGLSPLVAAAENGYTATVRLLLSHGALPNVELTNGNYPLRAAILSGDGECVRALLEHGADVNHCRLRLASDRVVGAGRPALPLLPLLRSGGRGGASACSSLCRVSVSFCFRLVISRSMKAMSPRVLDLHPELWIFVGLAAVAAGFWLILFS